jgi:hypothetical protein
MLESGGHICISVGPSETVSVVAAKGITLPLLIKLMLLFFVRIILGQRSSRYRFLEPLAVVGGPRHGWTLSSTYFFVCFPPSIVRTNPVLVIIPPDLIALVVQVKRHFLNNGIN